MKKKEFIKSFDVKLFIDAQRQFYNYDFSIDSETDSLEQWSLYVKGISENKDYKIDFDRLSELEKQENKNNERLNTRLILDKVESTYLNDIEFRNFTNLINCDYEIEKFNDRVKDGIKPKSQIIEHTQKDIIENLNLEFMESVQYSELPISKEYKNNLVCELCNILLYQFLESQKPQIEPTPSVSNSKELSKIAKIKKGLAYSAKDKVMILRYLGVFENDIFKMLNETQKGKLLSQLFGGDDETNIKDYILTAKLDKTKIDYLDFIRAFIEPKNPKI